MGRMQPMGHQQRCGPTHEFAENIQEFFFRGRIQGAGRLIQQQDRRIPQKGPGDPNPLPLPSAQHDAPLPHRRVISLRQLPDKAVRLCFLSRFLNFPEGCARTPIRDIFPDTAVEEHRLLQNQRLPAAQILFGKLS